MITLTIICLVAIIAVFNYYLFIKLKKTEENYDYGNELAYIFIIVFTDIIGFIFVVCLACVWADGISSITNSITINEKIAMYETTNADISEDINTLVINYQDYEKDIFKNSKEISPVVVVNMYPELKSDKLVNKQIDIYTKNQEKIRKLKLEKIEVKKSKFMIYFGN